MCEFCGDPNCPGSDMTREIAEDPMLNDLREKLERLMYVKDDEVFLNLEKGCVVYSQSNKYKIRGLQERLRLRMQHIANSYGAGIRIMLQPDDDDLPEPMRTETINIKWSKFLQSD